MRKLVWVLVFLFGCEGDCRSPAEIAAEECAQFCAPRRSWYEHGGMFRDTSCTCSPE